MSFSPSTFEWKQVVELGYSNDDSNINDDMADSVCFNCGKEETKNEKLNKCSKCHVATYCSRDCQVSHWNKGSGGGHKHCCEAYKRVSSDMMITFPEDKEIARTHVFQRIRFYACPYFVYKSETSKERGFLFIQSDSTLAEMSLPIPVLANGRLMSKARSVLMHFLTIEEYDKDLCRDDFEMAMVRNELVNSVNNYTERMEMAILMRFRCGHIAVGITKLIPDHLLCQTLGREYFKNDKSGAVQLNIDDV